MTLLWFGFWFWFGWVCFYYGLFDFTTSPAGRALLIYIETVHISAAKLHLFSSPASAPHPAVPASHHAASPFTAICVPAVTQ